MIATKMVKGAYITKYMLLNMLKTNFKSTFYNWMISDLGMLSRNDLYNVKAFLINFLHKELSTCTANS